MDRSGYEWLDDLRRNAFHDLGGTRITAHVPISTSLLNRILADALRGTSGPVRSIDIRPAPGDRFAVIVSVKWPFVPPVTVTVSVERQPVFPESPVLVLRWSLPAGLGAIASQFVGAIKSLPDGITLRDDRVLLDIPRLAARAGVREVLPHLRTLQLHTSDLRTVIDVELGVADV